MGLLTPAGSPLRPDLRLEGHRNKNKNKQCFIKEEPNPVVAKEVSFKEVPVSAEVRLDPRLATCASPIQGNLRQLSY